MVLELDFLLMVIGFCTPTITNYIPTTGKDLIIFYHCTTLPHRSRSHHHSRRKGGKKKQNPESSFRNSFHGFWKTFFQKTFHIGVFHKIHSKWHYIFWKVCSRNPILENLFRNAFHVFRKICSKNLVQKFYFGYIYSKICLRNE